ncbi:Phytochrome two-component sensor histidine kinase Cyanobacterial phytochrome B [Paramagnetospirillum magnetotacticum MS-1]|uniref:histidine kinase n=1 Tax=Paramagnetospirillum magnetotacticum MS-1 TaxID=272627 RepID=A0A0C2V4H5_PARME|nr:ATP-binding protein [Paramagnetospirillum magnetotacticum]KIL99981.1 Phytochrome two-component sensor histidine kinase Cyanobacterial phytochrome B [Paramagnetospirillum magnetotacticum MS-1]
MMMMMMLRKKGRENRIGRRLILLIVAFSSFLALLATAYQLFNEYQQQRADMDDQLEQVRIFLPPITGSVWTFDERQITLALDALTRLSHVEHAVINTSDGRNTWSSGSIKSKRLLNRQFILAREVRGEMRPIATLDVAASLDGIYGRLLSQAVTILVTNTLKTFLVAAFMYVIFSRIVTRRVEDLARNVGSLMPESLMSQASMFDDKLGFPENGDEIDRLRWAYDNIARQLKLAVQDLHDRHDELQHEIHERTRAESDLQQVIAELSRTNAELERFAYVAAHDLQEPVRGLVSFSQLLERKYAENLGSEGNDYLRFIINEALRMSNLVRDLLEYSRAGGTHLNLGDVDCRELVHTVVQSLRPNVEQKNAVLEIGDLPGLIADQGQLYQVFHNLLGNALKYSDEGNSPRIRINAERDGNSWRFEVADNGIGIEAQYHDYVFEVFRRLHTGTAYSGTGIGLAICKRIVESHGGRMWLTSTPGQGSTFFFTIPDQAAKADAALSGNGVQPPPDPIA